MMYQTTAGQHPHQDKDMHSMQRSELTVRLCMTVHDHACCDRHHPSNYGLHDPPSTSMRHNLCCRSSLPQMTWLARLMSQWRHQQPSQGVTRSLPRKEANLHSGTNLYQKQSGGAALSLLSTAAWGRAISVQTTRKGLLPACNQKLNHGAFSRHLQASCLGSGDRFSSGESAVPGRSGIGGCPCSSEPACWDLKGRSSLVHLFAWP